MRKEMTVTGATRDGKVIAATIVITKKVVTTTVNADGDIIETGTKAEKTLSIVMTVDGKQVVSTNNAPKQITNPKGIPAVQKLLDAGVYAQLGDKYITQDMYTKITAAIAELEIATETEEFAQVEAEEIATRETNAKQAEEYYKHRDNMTKAMGY